MKRIGITMRVVQSSGYEEPRDALAQDWNDFMTHAFDDVAWMPIPNIGIDVKSFVNKWNLNAFILSGGNDVGTEELRDATEKQLLDVSLENNFPIFGVCRGLQFLQHYFRGRLDRCDAATHVAETHHVRIEGESHPVNSYHNFGIRLEHLSPQLKPFAVTDDGWVEGATVSGAPIQAVMWHPERDKPYRELDVQLMRNCLVNGVFI